jgi:hypothetical protein
MSMNTASEEFIGLCRSWRVTIDEIEKTTRRLMYHGVFQTPETRTGQHAEMKANVMLAFRHLEDTRMRLGKVIQAAEDGVSVYDRPAAAAQ